MNPPSTREQQVRLRVVDGDSLDEVAVTADGRRLLRIDLDAALTFADDLTIAVEQARRRVQEARRVA